MKTIILASESPRRKELLAKFKIKFKVIKPNIKENFLFKKPSKISKDLAYRKAFAITKKIDYPAVIIAADTIVFCKGEIIGKPKSYKDAERILRKLMTYPHYVYTGFAVLDLYGCKNYIDYDRTKIIMNKIPDEILPKIIEAHRDKAGCYAIQTDDKLVKSIKGDYYNVVGLPIYKVLKILKKCINGGYYEN